MPEEIPNKLSASDISFREMSEGDAVKAFQDDGYFDFEKRSMRYGPNLPKDSIWATAPARMFVAFSNETPVAVIGFSRYKGFLLDAGVHVREGYRKKGLGSILLDKIINEKGNKTLLVNVANPAIVGSFRRKGFIDMIINEIPKELQEELEGIKYPDQLQKWMMYASSEWQRVLKRWN
tara:strand:+ start:1577 stop:2110 length:534 start_codon:yes stop_codon:yes gene_type:complete